MNDRVKGRTPYYLLFALFAAFLGLTYWGVRHTCFRSPRIYANQPLRNPVRLRAILPPATAVLRDGRQCSIYGIRMIRPIPNVEDVANEKGLTVARIPVKVELMTPDALASKMNYAAYNLYFCGNSFTVRWFPEDLPRYHPEDLATLLVSTGSALPTIDLLNTDRDYALKLIRATDVAANSFRLDLPKGDSYWWRLGWVMAKQYPEAVTTAADIISRTGDGRAVSLAKQRIDTLLTTTEHRYSWDRDRELSQLVRTIDRISAEESQRAEKRIRAKFGKDWKMQSD